MIIDTNVYLSRWPFRRLHGDEPEQLVAKLIENNVSQAWAGSFDAILHEDLSAANARLAADCRAYGKGLLLPFGSVNPALPDWQEDFRRCHENHKMRGIRLHPNYHGYTLDNPRFGELAALAARTGMVVQVVLSMEDERTQHPLVRGRYRPPAQGREKNARPSSRHSQPHARAIGQTTRAALLHRRSLF